MDNQIAEREQSQSPALTAAVRSVDYVGGIIGLFIDDRKKLERAIQTMNDRGYRLRTVLPAKHSVFSILIQVICLSITFMFHFNDLLN